MDIKDLCSHSHELLNNMGLGPAVLTAYLCPLALLMPNNREMTYVVEVLLLDLWPYDIMELV